MLNMYEAYDFELLVGGAVVSILLPLLVSVSLRWDLVPRTPDAKEEFRESLSMPDL